MKKPILALITFSLLFLFASCDHSNNTDDKMNGQENLSKIDINNRFSVSGDNLKIDKENKIISADVIYLHFLDNKDDNPSTRSSSQTTVDLKVDVLTFLCGVDDIFFQMCAEDYGYTDVSINCDNYPADEVFIHVAGFKLKATKNFIIGNIPLETAQCIEACSPVSTFEIIK